MQRNLINNRCSLTYSTDDKGAIYDYLKVNAESKKTTGEAESVDFSGIGTYSSCSMNVKRGDLIGFMDNTAYSGGTHLHYEVWKNDSNSTSKFNICDEEGFGIDCTNNKY